MLMKGDQHLAAVLGKRRSFEVARAAAVVEANQEAAAAAALVLRRQNNPGTASNGSRPRTPMDAIVAAVAADEVHIPSPTLP